MRKLICNTADNSVVEITTEAGIGRLRANIILDNKTIAEFDLADMYELIYDRYASHDCSSFPEDYKRKVEMCIGRMAFSKVKEAI